MKTDDTTRTKIMNKIVANTLMLPLNSKAIAKIMLLTILISYIVTSNSFCTNDASAFATFNSFQNPPSVTFGKLPFVRLANTKIFSAPPRKRPEDEYCENIYEDSNDKILKSFRNKDKSEESSFWYSVGRKSLSRPEDVVPYQEKLDCSGPLPYGSYRVLGREEYEAKPVCLLSIALDFWNAHSNNQNSIDTSSVIQNVHQLIDSGFTSFQLHNHQHRASTSRNGYQSTWKQTFTEQNIYHKIVQETPTSVLNQCTFGTRINVPPLVQESSYQTNYDTEGGSHFVFKESLIRQNIGESISNIYGKSDGCIDAVQVNFQKDEKNDMSPYTFDVLSVLSDMQREGLISSISGLNFPSHAISEIEKAGFSLDYNQFDCNLLNPTEYVEYMQHTKTSNEGYNNKRAVLSSTLAGGLLTNRYSNIPRSLLNHQGVPFDKYMLPSEAWHYKHSLINSWIPNQIQRNDRSYPWQVFQNEMMKVLEEIANKHQVSIASVVLRWSIQLDEVGCVVVGSSLNAHFDYNDRPYTRQNDLRQVFSFLLDEEDMDRLWNVCGGYELNQRFNNIADSDGEIDFGNSRLWL